MSSPPRPATAVSAAGVPASPPVEPAPKKARSGSPRPKTRSRSPSPTAVLRPSKNRTTVADSATSQTAMHLGDYTPSEWASLPSTAQRASAHVETVTAFTPFSERSPALRYTELATCGKARAGRLELPHGVVRTPVFMPVGTQGTLKGICSQQVAGITAGPRSIPPPSDLTYSVAAAEAFAAAVAKGLPAPATVPPSAPAPASAAAAVALEAKEKGDDVKVDIILGNTYHLGVRPGTDIVHRKGGLHHFMNWPRNILTDSGGFQMVSLVELAEITEAGVKFRSPVDGSALLLTPERSVQYQNEIGGDILMALDDVCHSMTVGPRVEEAMERSIRWLDRCIAAHKKSHVQNLFGIIQGGLQAPLRERCLEAMIKRDLPGYAIGGLAGGEEKAEFWRVVDLCTKHLPRDKPRYLMGVGYPVDLLVCVAMGVDMFDCVWPCRTARFGTAIVPDGLLKLQKTEYKDDQRVICEDCPCDVCRKWKYPRSFLHHIAGRQPLGCHLLTIHNIGYMAFYMDQMRTAILEERFPTFVYDQLKKNFPDQRLPSWVYDALSAQGFLFTAADTPYGEFIRDEDARAAADVRIAPRERPEGMRDPEAARAAAEAAAAAALPVEVALAALAKTGAGAGAATDVKHGAQLDIASAPRK